MFMSCRVTEGSAHAERLRADYKAAFEEWVLQVNRLRALDNSARVNLIPREAEARVAAAEIAYRNSRDRLTDDMVTDCAKGGACD